MPRVESHLNETHSHAVAHAAWPVALILLEATSLTPFVEFSSGGMALLANPLILSAGIITLATFFLLLLTTGEVTSTSTEISHAAGNVTQASDSNSSMRDWLLSPWRTVNLRWLMTHFLLLALFTWITLLLHAKIRSQAVSWLLALGWFTLGAAVALSIALAFLTASDLRKFVRRYLLQAAVASVIGFSMLILISPVRGLWTKVDDPGLEMVSVMLNIYPGDSNVDTVSERWPIVGTNKLALIVTPPCSELESILAFLLLGGTLWVAQWEKLSPWRFLLVLIAGLAIGYLLVFFRLYLLIVIGQWVDDAYFSVNLAHSRIGTLLLLIISLLMLYGGSKLAVRPLPEPMEEELEEDAEAFSDSPPDETPSEIENRTEAVKTAVAG